MKKRGNGSKVGLAVVVAALAVVGGVSLFGDHVRRLFGMSADALAGQDDVALRSAPSSGTIEQKKMMNFGANNEYGPSPVAAGAPAGVYAPPPAPNPTTDTRADRFSTFAIDVDTASYSRAREQIEHGGRADAYGIRVEEWVNAFTYALPAPERQPFSIHLEGAPSPFDEQKTLLKVSLQGKRLSPEQRATAHLVFLVDTSCSMSADDRLPLAQESMRILTRNLNPRDTVSIVTYAGAVEDVLPPTPAENQQKILAAIDDLYAEGGTAMGSGLELAYRHADALLAPGHVSRVLVFTDGDANIGATSPDQMLAAVREHVKRGVTLTAVGFGMGNYRDDLMEKLADSGNGQCVYIDSVREAKKVFQTNLAGTLETIARDVKVQVEFDPDAVRSYRLLGYEDRDVADKDFRNDEVDGGEIGAGHSVTALYELVLNGHPAKLGTVRVRGKLPKVNETFEVAKTVEATQLSKSLEASSTELRFAAAVGVTADVLRGNPNAPTPSLRRALALAKGATRGLPERLEFVELLEKVLATRQPAVADR